MSNWKDFFSFTKQERNGIFVLIALIICATTFLFLQPLLFESKIETFQIPQEFLIVDSGITENGDSSSHVNSSKHEPETPAAGHSQSIYQGKEFFAFNPNGLPEEDWVKLGLSPAQAKSVKNFENKGGFFKSKEDVQKLYVISPEKYLELEPFIVIPERKRDSSFKHTKKETSFVYELNTADTSDLVKINGIGPVFAQRIVSYRKRLGGFHHKEQLKEVFGIDDEKFSLIQASIKVDSTYITKINVNTVEVSELRKHPYFTPGLATAIVNYRKQHGKYTQLIDVMKCHLVNAELYRKIAPYLTI